MDSIDTVIVGAGVVGLALARECALRGHETLLLEAAARIGTGVSARSSEVIHAGIYYPQGSLKARLCVAGRERLYEFCQRHGVGHRRCGKLIVAVSAAQRAQLDTLTATAAANGVELLALDAAAARALEPALACAAALCSPRTGIVDSQGLMLALLGEAQRHGAILSTGSTLTRVILAASGVLLGVNGCEPGVRARRLINCAGIAAPAVARLMEGLPGAARLPRTHFARGNYFALEGRAPFRHLIYPVPEPGGLGIHLTLDLAGAARFGPDVEWLEREDYTVNPDRAARFDAAIRTWWPGLPQGALKPAYAAIRPRITAEGEVLADFRIEDAAVHGVPGLINLFGIESPGLTASLALASEVAARLDEGR
jgi:L-2-hydroxyglutarate oxidase LhgO